MIEIISTKILTVLPSVLHEDFAVRITDTNAERIVGLNRYLSEERRKLRRGREAKNKKRTL